MGHSESIMVQERLARFRPEEGDVVEGMFDHLLHDGVNSAGDPKEKAAEVLTFDTLKSSMGSIASESMIKRVYRSMCSVDPGMPSSPTTGTRTETGNGTVPGVHREQLIIFIADVLVGTPEERAPLVMAMTQQGSKLASCEQVAEFLQELVSAVVQILVHRGRLQGWKPDRMGDCSLGVKLLVEQMCSELKPSDERSCDVTCLEDWISRVSQVAVYLEMLVVEGLDLGLTSRPAPTLLPLCRETQWNNLHCMLDLPTLMLLASKIPDSYSAPWRLLYSTQLHGESFSRIMGNCTKHGPTLLIVKDTKGHVFGGYASHAWEVKPQFQGDASCFLFTVFPSLRVYTCTGYNQNYMYLNHDQQTMPNGLGMGGQHGYFGLWLDSDFGRGHSRAKPKCTTYGSPQLSGEEEFTLDSMEVWGVGKPIDCDNENKRSVLKVDPELQAMMEITGKTLHSQGLRELEEDDDSVCSK